MAILVTGGAGYIGSHTCVEFLDNNEDVVIIDNLCNSNIESLKRVENITKKVVKYYIDDILDKNALRKIFSENKIEAVIHFAGLKAVGESVSIPLEYYHNNINGTLALIDIMKEFNCKNLVFSSSATVYGDSEIIPIPEDVPLSATNPYGRTKLFIEYILKDLYKSDNEWNIAILRYFNPIGAHSSGLIGEDPNGVPNNLMPFITQVAVGKLDYLRVFGNDYNTHDGTGVRDFIHVCDLAHGHLCALNKLREKPGLVIYNLGTGNGYSVLDMVKTFEQVNGVKIPYKVIDRRPGDIAVCYADASKAEREMGFKTVKSLNDMCRDSWNWQSKNPNGYK